MLMPDKHIRFAESLLGLGSFVLDSLGEPKTIDELWGEFCRARKKEAFPAPHSFENLVMAVDALYALGTLTEINQSGVLRRCD